MNLFPYKETHFFHFIQFPSLRAQLCNLVAHPVGAAGRGDVNPAQTGSAPAWRCDQLWFGQGHLSPAWNKRATRALVAVVAAFIGRTCRPRLAWSSRLCCNSYPTNRLEQDHRGIKQRYSPMRGLSRHPGFSARSDDIFCCRSLRSVSTSRFVLLYLLLICILASAAAWGEAGIICINSIGFPSGSSIQY